MGGRLAATLFGVLALPGWTAAASATELWARGDASVEFSGSLRQIALYTKQTDMGDFVGAYCPLASELADCAAWDELGETDVGQALTRLRVRLDMQLTSWLSASIAYDNQAFYGSIDTLEAGLAAGMAPETFFGAEGVLAAGPHVKWTHRLYRGYAQADLPFGEQSAFARVGRQKVAWGVGNLWNPIDRFDPNPPLAIQGDENAGIDAALLRWSWSGFDFIEGVYAPGTSPNEARYAAHVHWMLFDTDVSLIGGVYQKAPTAGFDIARNWGDAAVYLEVVWADPRQEVWRIGDSRPAPPDDFWQVVAGMHHSFDFGEGVYVVLEHLYNGNALGFGEGKAGSLLNFFEQRKLSLAVGTGEVDALVAVPASSAIAGSSGVVTFAKHQTGLLIGYDLTPELRADFIALFDWGGYSAAFFPNLSYTPLDFLELRIGAQFFTGPRLSQYGANEPLAYIFADVFF